ncbi:MAG: outer membrane beta-barrel protein [Bacteroidales bacterium]|nr:outer membrane beta-barrel protein [Bacteroidales bacterium]
MKKIAIVLLFMITTCSVKELQAQWYLGGNLDFGVESRFSDYKTLNLVFSPDFGYSFNSQWSLGGAFLFQYKYTKFPTSLIYITPEISSEYVYGIAPYFRYGFFNREKLKLFIDGLIYVNRHLYSDSSSDIMRGAWSFCVGARIGAEYRFTDHFKMDVKLSAVAFRYNTQKTYSIGLHLNDLSLGMGFYYVF